NPDAPVIIRYGAEIVDTGERRVKPMIVSVERPVTRNSGVDGHFQPSGVIQFEIAEIVDGARIALNASRQFGWRGRQSVWPRTRQSRPFTELPDGVQQHCSCPRERIIDRCGSNLK